MMKVLSFINQKGGTGKTTLAVHSAYHFSRKGRSVILVDLDPQGHAAKCLGVFEKNQSSSSSLIFSGKTPEPVQRSSNLWVLPSDPDIARKSLRTGAESLREGLIKLSEYLRADTIILDSPPSMDHLTRGILYASDYVVVPVAVNYLSLEGCAGLLKTIEDLKKQTRTARPEVILMVPTFYRNTKLAKEILNTLKHHFGDLVSETALGFSVKIDEAQSFGKTVMEYAPSSRGARMLKDISDQILQRLN